MSVNRQELEQFLGGYFHQDWMLESARAEEVVDRYLADESSERVRRAAGQLADLLATADSEEALQAVVLGELGCSYSPSETMREWLESVRARLESALGGPERTAPQATGRKRT